MSSAIDNYPWLVIIDFHSLFYHVCYELVFLRDGICSCLYILSSGARTCIPRYRSESRITRRMCTVMKIARIKDNYNILLPLRYQDLKWRSR